MKIIAENISVISREEAAYKLGFPGWAVLAAALGIQRAATLIPKATLKEHWKEMCPSSFPLSFS